MLVQIETDFVHTLMEIYLFLFQKRTKSIILYWKQASIELYSLLLYKSDNRMPSAEFNIDDSTGRNVNVLEPRQ